jgi:hypothetical protein
MSIARYTLVLSVALLIAALIHTSMRLPPQNGTPPSIVKVKAPEKVAPAMPVPASASPPLFLTDDSIMPDKGRASNEKSVPTIAVRAPPPASVSPPPPPLAPPQAPVKYQPPLEQVKLEQEAKVPERNDICARYHMQRRDYVKPNGWRSWRCVKP